MQDLVKEVRLIVGVVIRPRMYDPVGSPRGEERLSCGSKLREETTAGVCSRFSTVFRVRHALMVQPFNLFVQIWIEAWFKRRYAVKVNWQVPKTIGAEQRPEGVEGIGDIQEIEQGLPDDGVKEFSLTLARERVEVFRHEVHGDRAFRT
jgi:hypothetical protein